MPIGPVVTGSTGNRSVAKSKPVGESTKGLMNRSVGARLVLKDEPLAQLGRNVLADGPQHRVHATAGGRRHHDGHGPVRIGLRLADGAHRQHANRRHCRKKFHATHFCG
jgi:hypothetical protein